MGNKNRRDKIKQAIDEGDIERAKEIHKKEFVVSEEDHRGDYLSSFIFGSIDGIITTFAIVAGVTGADLSAGIVLILGLANLLADGISMAVGDYLSKKSNIEYIEKQRDREVWEIENIPQAEKEEIRAIYKEKGFKGQDLDKIVEVITSDKKRWLKTIMREELGVSDSYVNPIKSSIVMFFSFVLVGAVPLISYALSYFWPAVQAHTFLIASILTFIAFFAVGASKTFITEKSWLRSGLETLFIGGVAAVIAYVVGALLKGIQS